MSENKKKKSSLKTSEKNGDVEVIELPKILEKEKEEAVDEKKEMSVEKKEMLVEKKEVPVEKKEASHVEMASAGRRMGVREYKIIVCSVVFVLTMMAIIPLSSPPHTTNKTIGIGVMAAVGVLLIFFVSLTKMANDFIKEDIMPLIGTEEDDRKKFLMTIIEMDESRDLYIRDAGLKIDRNKISVENASSYMFEDDLVVTFSFREMESNRFCKLTLDSISYKEYSATNGKTRASIICEKLAATARAFQLFQ